MPGRPHIIRSKLWGVLMRKGQFHIPIRLLARPGRPQELSVAGFWLKQSTWAGWPLHGVRIGEATHPGPGARLSLEAALGFNSAALEAPTYTEALRDLQLAWLALAHTFQDYGASILQSHAALVAHAIDQVRSATQRVAQVAAAVRNAEAEESSESGFPTSCEDGEAEGPGRDPYPELSSQVAEFTEFFRQVPIRGLTEEHEL